MQQTVCRVIRLFKARMDRVVREKGLVVTETDLELFWWLWMLRVMTLAQLRRVGYYQEDTGQLSSFDNVRKRLRRLWKKGYISGDVLLSTKERIYQLAEHGLEELRIRRGLRQRRLYKARGRETLRHVRHSLLVSECAVRFMESVRGSSLGLVELEPLGVPFCLTHTVGDPKRRKHTERFVSQEDLGVGGHAKPLRIRPDLVFALTKGERARLYFLEADRGTESSAEIAAKMLAYHHYREHRDPKKSSRFLWQRYGEVQDFRVLLVTTEKTRVESLSRYLDGKPGYEVLAVVDEATLRGQNIVFGAAWRNAHGKSRPLAQLG